jgi:chromate transporter
MLFVEYFKISLFVVGGGYAIIITADDVFGRRLKWLEEGELLDHLPIFQTVPGLIAGNSAIYVGLRVAGMTGAVVALLAVALPSLVIISAIATGFKWLPTENAYVQGAFLGLRSALCGIVLATLVKSWPRIMNGLYAYIAAPLCCVAIIGFGINAGRILVCSILFGIFSLAVAAPLYRRLTLGGKAAP